MKRSQNLRWAFLYAKWILPVLGLFAGIYFLIQIFPWFLAPVFAVAYSFVLFFVLDTIVRKKFNIKQFMQDLKKARHIVFVVWIIVTFLRANLLALQLLGRLKIHVNGKIPEGKWIAAWNHPDLMLRDVFVVPIVISFLKLKYLLNPLRWFPKTVADVHNYLENWFFKLVGNDALIGIYRDNGKDDEEENSCKKRKRWRLLRPLEFVRDFKENGGIRIFDIEAGRTTSALNRGEFETRIVGEHILVMGLPTLGAAWLSKLSNGPVVPGYIRIKGGELESRIKVFLATREQRDQTKPFFENPEASPSLGWRGWVHLFNPWGVSMELEIGLPSGPLMPIEEESKEEYTQRIYEAIFEVGKIQLRRSKRVNKHRYARVYVRKWQKFFQRLL